VVVVVDVKGDGDDFVDVAVAVAVAVNVYVNEGINGVDLMAARRILDLAPTGRANRRSHAQGPRQIVTIRAVSSGRLTSAGEGAGRRNSLARNDDVQPAALAEREVSPHEPTCVPGVYEVHRLTRLG
jgi:hypothetical protein